jgi:HK97 family phage portal protein
MRWPFLKREDPGEISIGPAIDRFTQGLTGAGFSPRLIDRVWSANRCVQLNAQQIASLPLEFTGTFEPAWVSSPDPHWYPNGIGDAVFAAVRSMYAWGDAFLLITDRYANGFPSGWTVLDPSAVNVELVDGRKQFRSGQALLNPENVVQVSRDPGVGLRGTSALTASTPHVWASITSGDLGQTLMGGGVPNAVLKSGRKLTEEQATALQAQWVASTALRRGAPAVLPPDLTFEQLAFSPKDLMLLDGQQFEGRVIAAAFGVPPYLLNLPLEGGLTYQSPEQLEESWYRFELRPTALRLSRALTANMLPRGNQVAFDMAEALAPLDGTRVAKELSVSPVADASPNVQPLRPMMEVKQ